MINNIGKENLGKGLSCDTFKKYSVFKNIIHDTKCDEKTPKKLTKSAVCVQSCVL